MPRRGPLSLVLLLAVFASSGESVRSSSGGGVAAPASFAVRMVKLGGEATDPRVAAHVAYCRKLGFNALWIYSGQTGAWAAARAPRGPVLDREFVREARHWRRVGLDLWVSLNPPADTDDAFVFSRREDEDRIVSYVALLRRKIHLRHLVVSFDDQPTELRELSDIFAYGRSAAPAHLDLMRRLAARLPPDLDLWMCASAYCDAHLGDGTGPYTKPFLEGLSSLPGRIGIVWTGPTVISPSITRKDIEATRRRLGGRRILLYDNAYANDDDSEDGMALVLAPLRRRDPGLSEVVAAYLACPMSELGGSRLGLATVADFLRDPDGYAPDASLAAAMRALAGPAAGDRDVWRAFDTQQLEWGGWVGERNYWPREALNPATVAGRLVDPAFVSSFTWTAERYPGRIALLERLSDAPFRDDLVRVMRRRLAVARAIPVAIEYLARVRAGRADAKAALDQIDAIRASLATFPDARRVLDLFLDAAGVPLT
jgi:beta-N-acetylglucosaminidase